MGRPNPSGVSLPVFGRHHAMAQGGGGQIWGSPPRSAAEPPATRRRYCAQRSAAAGEAVICPRRGIFWPLGDLNARKTTHIRAKPFEPAPSKGPFSLVCLPRGRGTQSLSRAARNDAAGTVLSFWLSESHHVCVHVFHLNCPQCRFCASSESCTP